MGRLEHKYLKGSLAICPSNKLTVSRFSGSVIWQLLYWLLSRFAVAIMEFFCGAALKLNQKEVGYPQNIHITNALVVINCVVGQYYSIQGLPLGKTVGDFSPLVSYMALLALYRLASREQKIPGQRQLDFSRHCT